MKKCIFAILFTLVASFKFSTTTQAQGTLIHYWHFNNFTTTYPYAYGTVFPIGPIDADFSTLDTSKARIYEATFPGTSPGWHSIYVAYIDPYPTVTGPTGDYDTVNLRMGQPGGTALRPRNPLDSAYLLFYIPTNNYQNILLTWGAESSSTGSGDGEEWFDYSVDSGATFTTTGLSELYDSAWLVFHRISVTFANPLVNNNPRLVFRIHFINHTTGSSGNNRFDNVTVDGDTLITAAAITTTPGAFGPYCNGTTTLITVPFTTIGTFTGSFSLQLSNSSGSFSSGTTIIGSGTTSPIIASIPFGTPTGTYRLRVINTVVTPAVYGSDNGSDIIVSGPPVAYAVTGGGAVCAGASGVPIGVANSQLGASYQIYLSGAPVGSPVIGTGSAITVGNVNVAGTYFVRASFGGSVFCTTSMTGSATVTVSPAPAPITGTMNVCAGQTVPLHDATTGGTWSSSSISLATVVSASGVVTGVASGNPTITYTAAGCSATAIITVNPLSPITGVTNVCVGATTALSDAISGGTWSAGNTNASVNSITGVVTGVTSGTTSVVIYTTPGGCQAITTMSINISPSPIGGATTVCASATTNLTDVVTGGTWTSSTASVATISTTGTVTGVAIGTTGITYSLSDGCAASTIVAVSLAPGPIGGPSAVCAGTAIALTDVVSGGLWTSSSSTTIATIGSLTGQVTGVNPGTTTITYSLGTSCSVTKTITVNPSPLGITGSANICLGTTAALNDLTSGGTWSSSTSAVGITSGGSITGAGVGTSTISYSLAGSGCSAVTTVTVNTAPLPISGASNVCAGLTTPLTDGVTGGTWSSPNTTVSVGSSGSVSGVSAGSAIITYAIGSCTVTKPLTINPVATMSGPTGVCVGSTAALTPSIIGGTWSSAPTSIATVNGSGVVTGALPGAAVITYVLATGCTTTTSVTVNTIPTAISGILQTCVGSNTSLGDGASGGTWSISPASRATVGISSGAVTGVSAGTAAVTYSLGTGCTVFATVTINPLPLSVSGTPQVCLGLTTSLTDGTTGGTWASTNTSIASVSVAGIVNGLTPGNDTISYTIPTGCMSIAVLTINPLPLPITVSGYVCLGLNTGLSDPSGGGGTWSSSNTALATIDPTTGVVTGVGAGAPTITYTLPTTCIATLVVTVNAIAPPITGTHHTCEGLTTSLADPLMGGLWSTSDGTIATINSAGLVTGVSAGTVTVSYVTAICPATTVVTINPIPGAIGGTTLVCAGSSTSLIEPIGGTWSSSNMYIASVDPATGITRGQAAGVAEITYTIDLGCATAIPVTVDPLPAPITGAANVCLGTTLSLGETTTGGTWSSINTSVATVNSSGLITSVSDGAAIVSYTIASGCAATRTIDVVSVPAITGAGNICAWGGTLTVHDSIPGGSWTSSLVSVSDSGLVTGTAPGIGSVTYTLPSGCSNSATITVNPLPGPVTGNTNLCVGLTTILNDITVVGVWSSSNSSVASVAPGSGIVTGVSAGSATISFTNGMGCAATTTVFVHSLPSAILGTTSVCAGSSVILSDAVPGGVWSSSNIIIAEAATGGTVTGMSAGVATITYNVGASCIATENVTVNPLPATYSVTGGGVYCAGGTGLHIGLSSSFVGVNYKLYYGITPVGSSVPGTYSNIDFGLQTAAGTYSVIATNAITGCTSDMGGTTITVMPLPSLHTVTGGGSYCSGGTGVHIGLGTSDVGTNYQLYDGAATASGIVTGTGTALDFGLHTSVGTYGVIATSGVAGCSAHMPDSVTVTITPLVTPAISVTSSPGGVICAGAAATFTATPVNGGTTPTYQWKVNGSGVSAAGPSYSYIPANGDIVKAVLTSDAACASPDTASSSVTMTVQPLVVPSVTVTANPGASIIAGQYDTLTATVTNGGTTPGYQWKLNGNVVAGATNSTYISNSFSNLDIITCTITSSGTCAGQTASATITIVVHSGSGVQQITSADNIRVVPNPNKGEFTISGTLSSASTGVNEEVSFEITNMLGQVIYKDAITTLNGGINKRVSLNTIANGMYILSLRSGTDSKVFHMVIEQ